MRRSVLIILVAELLLGTFGCSSKQPEHTPPGAPLFEARTATLEITNGTGVPAMVALPPGFAPDPAHPPMWLQNGAEVAVIGGVSGRTTVLGLSGATLGNHRLLMEDYGPGAPHGQIVDIAASPDGMELAAAVLNRRSNQLQVVVRDVIARSGGNAVASVDGTFAFVQVTWLDQNTIALALRAPAGATLKPESKSAADSAGSASGLYLIRVTGAGGVEHLDKLRCALSPMSWSPNRRLAVGQGATAVAPVLIDRHSQTCVELPFHEAIRVLAWSPNSNAFLYAARTDNGRSVGVFRYNLAPGKSVLVAVSSSAAAWAADGTILAVGNGELSWRRVNAEPNLMAKAEIALFDPQKSVITINSLGFLTLPAMLADSRMVFSEVSDDGVLETLLPADRGPRRELIEYSYPTRTAFVLATGIPGPLAMSWSPDGRTLALADGDANTSTLTLIVPPR